MKETNIVALEIGSSKIKGAVGLIDGNGVLTVLTVDEEPLLDMVRYGVVSNAEEVAIKASNLLDRLEDRCGNKTIQGVYVALGSRSLRSNTTELERILPGDGIEISSEIIEQMITESAENCTADRDLIDVIPFEYLVDGKVVRKPSGSLGNHILMRSNIITCRPQIRRNLSHLINEKLGLDINGYIVRQLAQADFVLSPDEKSLGCMLVDCGAETITVSIYKNEHLRYVQTIPMGSRNITRDLVHLNLLEEQAEYIKRNYGNAKPGAVAVNTPSDVDINTINKYVAARVGEIIANIKEQIKYAGFTAKALPAGIILVGHGARLDGFSERLADSTEMKVRLGTSVRTDVRLADPRISLTDSVEVISVLYNASRHNPMECMRDELEETIEEPTVPPTPYEDPTPEEEPEEDILTDDDDDDDYDDDDNNQPVVPKKKGFIKNWVNRVGNKLIEAVTDPDDDIMTDDKD